MADLPAKERAFVMTFWESLKPTGQLAPCPRCGTQGLEVRTGSSRGRAWRYVLHCASVRPIAFPEHLRP